MKRISLVLLFILLTLSLPMSHAQELSMEEIGILPANYEENSLVFSSDGQEYAYVIQTENGQQVIHNGESPDQTFNQIGSILFSPVTNKLFYWAIDPSPGDQTMVLVADGEVMRTDFEYPGALAFSPDGERWAAIVGTKDGVVVMVDGERVGLYPDTTWVTFSPDGEHFVYLTENTQGNMSLVVDGQIRQTYQKPTVTASNLVEAYLYGPNLTQLMSVAYLSDETLLVLTQDQNGWTIYKGDTALAVYLQDIWGGGSHQVILFEGFDTVASILAYSLTTAKDAPVA